MTRSTTPTASLVLLGRAMLSLGLLGLLAVPGTAQPADQPGPAVQLQRLDGQPLRGELLRCSPEQLQLRTPDGAPLSVPMEQLASIAPAAPPARLEEPWQAELLDGSLLRGRRLSGNQDRWTLHSDQQRWEIPAGQLAWLLLRPPTPAEQPQWRSWLESPPQGDALVIDRGRGNLDLLTGLVVGIDDGQVEFDFDGETVRAPLDRLLGIIWYRPSRAGQPPAMTLEHRDGSAVRIAELAGPTATAQGWQLEWQSADRSRRGRIAWDELLQIDLSTANVRWLAAVTLLERQAAPRTPLAASLPAREQLLGPRFGPPPSLSGGGGGGGGGGQTGADSPPPTSTAYDLLFPGPGHITLRVPEGWGRLITEASPFATGPHVGPMALEVLVDGEVVRSQRFSGAEQSVVLDVPVTPGSRLTLRLQAEGGLAAGAMLLCRQPRLLLSGGSPAAAASP
jgi:hypothetical protein